MADFIPVIHGIAFLGECQRYSAWYSNKIFVVVMSLEL
jgi:hypothetical protein